MLCIMVYHSNMIEEKKGKNVKRILSNLSITILFLFYFFFCASCISKITGQDITCLSKEVKKSSAYLDTTNFLNDDIRVIKKVIYSYDISVSLYNSLEVSINNPVVSNNSPYNKISILVRYTDSDAIYSSTFVDDDQDKPLTIHIPLENKLSNSVSVYLETGNLSSGLSIDDVTINKEFNLKNIDIDRLIVLYSIVTIIFLIVIFYLNYKLSSTNSYESNKNGILINAVCILFIVINGVLVLYFHHPFMFYDEFAYWTHAATIVGLDWDYIAQKIPSYYSYGYSLIIAPILLLFKSASFRYQAALYLNFVFMIVIWIFNKKIIRKVSAENINDNIVSLIALIGTIIPSYQVQSLITWSEMLLALLYTLLSYAVLCYLENNEFKTIIIMGIVAGFMFVVHNRTVGIAFSLFLFVLFLYLKKRIPLKHLFYFIICILIFIIINKYIKNYLQIIENTSYSGNDSSSFGRRLLLVLTDSKSFSNSLRLFFCELFILFVSTCGLGSLTYVYFFKNCKCYFKLTTMKDYYVLFLSLSSLAMMAISSINLIVFNRLDHIVYSRYFDVCTGLLVIMGLLILITSRKRLIYLLSSVVLSIPGSVFFPILSKTENVINAPNKTCSPGFFTLYSLFGNDSLSYIIISFLILSITCLIMFIHNKSKFRSDKAVLCYVLFISAIFTYMSFSSKVFIFNTHKRMDYDLMMVNTVSNSYNKIEYDETYYAPMYYFWNIDNLNSNIRIVDKTKFIDFEACKIIDSSFSEITLDCNNSNNISHIPLKMMNVNNAGIFSENNNFIISNDKNSVVCYGPYLNLPKGKYYVSFDLKIFSKYQENTPIGLIQCYKYGNDILNSKEILTNDKNDTVVNLEIELQQDTDNIELVCVLYQNVIADVIITDITLTKMN